MSSAAPHYLLLSETHSETRSQPGGWSFLLERIDGSDRVEAADVEPGVIGERLHLLAVVRGLQALEQPSKVTLLTPSRYIGRGIRSSITSWRENDWQWERFGQMVEVKHVDLWKKIDRAMKFHNIDCRVWNFARLFGRENTVASYANSINRRAKANELPLLEQPTNTTQYPVIKSRQESTNSWSHFADTVARTVNPFRTPAVYGYSG